MWVKETPTEEGWYWIKYRSKHGLTTCPCYVFPVGQGTLVKTANNASFFEGPNHGGPGLKFINGKGKPEIDTSIQFGPKIEEPK